METEKITREEYESQSGLEFLSEGIALVVGLGRSLAADMPLDTPQARHGLVIMMDHIAVVLAKAERKFANPNWDREADVQQFMRDDAELEALPD